MSVADSISGALQRFGRPMVLRRTRVGPGGVLSPLDVTVYGTADGYIPKVLVGLVGQGQSVVVISNTEIAAAQWPGPPAKNDVLIVDGKTRTIDGSDPRYLGTDVLVHICKVTGG